MYIFLSVSGEFIDASSFVINTKRSVFIKKNERSF